MAIIIENNLEGKETDLTQEKNEMSWTKGELENTRRELVNTWSELNSLQAYLIERLKCNKVDAKIEGLEESIELIGILYPDLDLVKLH